MAEKNKKDQTGEQEQDLSEHPRRCAGTSWPHLQAAGKDPFQQSPSLTGFRHTPRRSKTTSRRWRASPSRMAGRLMSKRGMGKVMLLRPAGQVRPHPALRPTGRDGRGGLQRVQEV